MPDIAALPESVEDEHRTTAMRRAETIGRPLGDPAFLTMLEARSGRSLTPHAAVASHGR